MALWLRALAGWSILALMPPKKARPSGGAVGLVSNRKLAKILKANSLDVSGVEPTSEWVIRQTVGTGSAECKALRIDLPMELTQGGFSDWTIFEPNRLLAHVLDRCPPLADAYGRAANESLPTAAQPWELSICFDEFIPGDKLKCYASRKCMVLGFNFANLGDEILDKDYSWFIPVVTRSSYLKLVRGDWSAMLAKYLRLQLFGPNGLATAGTVVMIAGQPLLLFAKVVDILSDYDGVRLGWDWRGANSLRPCLRCANCFRKGSYLAIRDGCADITDHDSNKFVERTDQDFENDVDLILAAGDEFNSGRMAPQRFINLQKATGQNYNPLGFVADLELRKVLRPLECLTQGWVHGVLSDGIMGTEMEAFLLRSKPHGFGREELEKLLHAELRFPTSWKTRGKLLWRVFSDQRIGEDKNKVRGDASEMLGLYALVRHFVELRFQNSGLLVKERKSLASCCHVVDCILDMKKGIVNPRTEFAQKRLDDAVFTHIKDHKDAYGTERVKPKLHLNHGLGEQYKRKGSARRVPL